MVYTVWTPPLNLSIWYTYYDESGWHAPQSLDTVHNAFFPTIAVDPAGTVHVVYSWHSTELDRTLMYVRGTPGEPSTPTASRAPLAEEAGRVLHHDGELHSLVTASVSDRSLRAFEVGTLAQISAAAVPAEHAGEEVRGARAIRRWRHEHRAQPGNAATSRSCSSSGCSSRSPTNPLPSMSHWQRSTNANWSGTDWWSAHPPGEQVAARRAAARRAAGAASVAATPPSWPGPSTIAQAEQALAPEEISSRICSSRRNAISLCTNCGASWRVQQVGPSRAARSVPGEVGTEQRLLAGRNRRRMPPAAGGSARRAAPRAVERHPRECRRASRWCLQGGST